jgi:hypothetical protein
MVTGMWTNIVKSLHTFLRPKSSYLHKMCIVPIMSSRLHEFKSSITLKYCIRRQITLNCQLHSSDTLS